MKSRLSLTSFAILAILLPIGSLVFENGTLYLITEALVILTIAQAWNFMAGYGGMLSLGNHLFVGAGAYAVTFLSAHVPVSHFVLVLAGGLVSIAVAIGLLPLLLRLRNEYFAIGMWVAATVVGIAVSRLEIFGQTYGMSVSPEHFGAIETIAPIAYLTAVLMTFALTAMMIFLSLGTRGYAIKAIRDDELAAQSIGVAVSKYRVAIFMVSAVACGLAGAIQAVSVSFITPQGAFDLSWTTSAVFIVIVGGIGTLWGPVFGLVIFIVLRESLTGMPELQVVLMGLLAVAITLFRASPLRSKLTMAVSGKLRAGQ
jgi:branched-chain amino acid transport system permease protein